MQTPTIGNGTASLTILIRPEPPGQHTAQVVGFPEFRVCAATPEAALEQVQSLLTQSLVGASWHQITVPPTNVPGHLLTGFGHAKDDPTFDQYLDAIRTFRQEMDEKARTEDRAG